LAGAGVILVVTAAVLPADVQGIFVVIVGLLAVTAVYVRTCRRLVDPRPWQWFVLAGVLFVAGNAILVGWRVASGAPASFPSIADPFFLGGYVTLLTGEVVLVRRRSSDAERDNLIDALMITAVVGVFLWAFVLAPAVQASQVANDQRALEIVYSLFDLLAIAGATRLAVGSGLRIPSYYFLAAALGCVLLADTFISLQTGGSDRSIPVSAISCLTFVLFALAGLHPSVSRLTEPPAPREIQLTSRRLAVLCAAFLVIPVGFAAGFPLDVRFDLPILIVGSVVLGLLAVARMAGLVHAKERKANRERLLREAGQALVMSTDRDQLYYVAALSAATLTQITGSGACVSAATCQDGRLVFGSWLGLDEDVLESASVVLAELPVPARHAVMSGGSCLIEPEGASIVASTLGLSPSRFTSLLLVPLKAREHPRGVLAIVSPRTIGLELRQSIELLAGHVTLALESAALTEEVARRRSERRFRALVEQSSDLVIVVGTDGLVSFVSPAIRTILGVPEEDALGRSALDRVHPDDRAQAVALLDRTWATEAVTGRTELRVRLGDGRYAWFELHAQNLAEEEEIGGAVIHAREVTDRKLAELQLSDSEARFRSLVQHAGDVVMVVDDKLQFSYLSPSVFRLLGYRSDELTGRPLGKLFHVNDARHAVRLISTGRSKDRETPIELRMRHASGRWISVETTITDLRHDPAVRGIVLNGRDIADRKALEHELRYKALHDLLTGLANRSLFIERLAETLSKLDATTRAAVIFIDLDDFKTVNDGMGHLLGDAVLIEVADRLRRCVRPGDLAARLGGDEFAVLIEGVAGRRDARRLGERILAALSEPVTLEGRELRIGASIGVALTGATKDTDGTVKGLLRDADQAMYGAKLRGKGRLQLFDPQMRTEISTRLVLTNDLATAVKRGEVFAQYQPIVDLRSGTLIGAEALARWQHPTRGLVPPEVFIPMAEQTGVIMSVGKLVIENACATLGEYKRMHPGGSFRMSINLSTRQLEHPDMSKQVASALRRHSLDPGDITLELTESLSPVNVELATARMGQLKEMGVRLAIDDFGIGYSSLAYLEQFPVDELKIDRSFISALESGGDAHIVTSIIGLAKARSLGTVAEGVETCGGARALASLGCDLAQGFYFSTPLDPVELSKMPSRIWQDPEREPIGV
jgi:diguanylate cyclase (GGDEF)-like protein/PAS domain S-box-containing protein